MPRYIVRAADGRLLGPYELDILRAQLEQGRITVSPSALVAADSGMPWVPLQAAIASDQPHFVQGSDLSFSGPYDAATMRGLLGAGRIMRSAVASPAACWMWQRLDTVWMPARTVTRAARFESKYCCMPPSAQDGQDAGLDTGEPPQHPLSPVTRAALQAHLIGNGAVCSIPPGPGMAQTLDMLDRAGMPYPMMKPMSFA